MIKYEIRLDQIFFRILFQIISKLKYSKSCYLLSSVDFDDQREYILNPTREQQENKMVCRLLSRTNCVLDKQRFWAIAIWATEFPSLELPASSNIAEYFDKLISRANTFEPQVIYDFATINLNPNKISVSSFRKPSIESSPYISKYTSTSFSCYESEILSIFCKIDIDKNNKGYFSKVTILSKNGLQTDSIVLDKSSVEEYHSKDQ